MKKIAAILGAFVVLLLIIALFLPMFFSTSMGKKMLLTMVSSRAGMTLEVDTLSLSWFGPQMLKGIRAEKPEENLTMECKELTTDSGLLAIALKNDLGQMLIREPYVQITKAFRAPVGYVKPSPLQAGLCAATPHVQLAMPLVDLAINGHIIVEGGKISVQSPGLDPIDFDQLAVSLDLKPEKEVALALSCSTSQQNKQGQIAVKAAASQLGSSFPSFSVLSSLSQLPVRAIDQMIALFSPNLSGFLYSTLGETIDMQCNLNAASGNVSLTLTANSPQMSAQIATQTAEGMITLKNPASLNFNLTPALFACLAKTSSSLNSLALSKAAPLQISVSTFSCPIPSQINDLLKTSLQATMTSASQMIFSLGGKPLVLGDLKMKLASLLLEKQVVVSLASAIQGADQMGSIALDARLDQPFSGTLQGTLAINASKMPVDLITLAAGGSPDLSMLLGQRADIDAKVEMIPVNPKLHLSWQSEFLSLPNLDISLKNPFSLISPASFTWTLNPQLFTQLARADRIQGTVNNLLIPVDNIKSAKMDVSFTTGQIVFKSNPISITKLQAQLNMNTFDQIGFTVEGDPLQVLVFGSLNNTFSAFTLTKPLLARFKIDNAILQSISAKAPQLIDPAVLQLSVDPATFELTNLDVNKINLKGQLSSTQMAFDVQGKKIALQNIALPFQWDSKAQRAALTLSAHMQNPFGKAGLIQGQFNMSNFAEHLYLANISGSLQMQNLSSVLLDVLSGQPMLSTLTGPIFSSTMKIQSSIDKQNLAIQWISPLLNADMAFVIDKSAIQQQGGAGQITWTLTPEAYQVVDRMITGPSVAMSPFEIKESSTFSASLAKLSLPILPKQDTGSLFDRIPNIVFDLSQLQLSATGSNPSLKFLDKTSKESIQLSSVSFTLNKNEQLGPLILSFDSGVVTQSGNLATKNGSLSLTGKLGQTLSNNGQFDWSKLTCGMQVKIQQFPSRALDLVARAKGRKDFPFTTCFGDLINASMHFELNDFSGPITLNLNTPRAKLELNGQLVAGALMLNEPITAQVKITPEMSRLVLKEVNPLNLSYLYSQAPVTLDIPSTGFYFPIYPSSLGKIAIPDATIELGKIACRNEGNVNITLGLLKTKQFDKSSELLLWFAPIELKVQKGIVNIDRTEILLADTFDICTWGKIDLIQDYVDMILGLTAQTLSKAFGIKNLPDNYVLLIPMKGPSNNVQINSSKATTKIALLLASQTKNIGGTAGAIVGDLLGKIATLPDSNVKVPPPKHPFPWEILPKPGKTSQASNEKKRQFKANEKPLKQILKIIRK